MVFLALLIITVVCLAYANGANDNFKGVATLAGCGTADYRTALSWATVTTLAGSLCATLLAAGLLGTFSGKGLVPNAVAGQPLFAAAVGLGAAATVMIATVAGIPISTTHALTGALVGAGLTATAGDIVWGALIGKFLVPLLISPLLAIVAALLAYPPLHWLRKRLRVSAETCICVGRREFVPVAVTARGVLESRRNPPFELTVDDQSQCVERYQGRVLGVSAAGAADWVHYASAGAVCFARSLNDTPKIVALLLAGGALAGSLGSGGSYAGFVAVGLFMALGGVLSARRVAHTMSHKITDMNVGQALTANLITSALVIGATLIGSPVSTTHVSCGSLIGIGTVSGRSHGKMIATILAAWLVTLPLAAALSMAAYFGLSSIGIG